MKFSSRATHYEFAKYYGAPGTQEQRANQWFLKIGLWSGSIDKIHFKISYDRYVDCLFLKWTDWVDTCLAKPTLIYHVVYFSLVSM